MRETKGHTVVGELAVVVFLVLPEVGRRCAAAVAAKDE